MGDSANGHACDAFITAFADDIVKKFRSRLLDQTFGDKVRYYVMADDNWEVHLYAAVATGGGRGETFVLTDAPISAPRRTTSSSRRPRRSSSTKRRCGADWRRRRCSARHARDGSSPRTATSSPAARATPRATRTRCTNRRRPGREGCPSTSDTRTTTSARGAAASTPSPATAPAPRATMRFLRNDACGIFDDDSVAQDAARSLYAERWNPCPTPGVSSHRAASAEAAFEGDRP